MLIKELKEFNQFIAIMGLRKVQVKDVAVFISLVRQKVGDEAEVQFFNADLIADWQHLYFATVNALTAFRNQLNISNSLAVEIILYASGCRQISDAIEKLGVKPETSNVAVLILSESCKKVNRTLKIVSDLIGGKPDDSVLELTDRKSENVKRLFEISDIELQAKLESEKDEKKVLTKLVIEHVALLSTKH
jgi:tRNA threonylcarbamoyladenosine modification (KEOPS) complex Cgi121 subunit